MARVAPMLRNIRTLFTLIRTRVKTFVRDFLLIRDWEGIQCLVGILNWESGMGRCHSKVTAHGFGRRGLGATIDRCEILLVLLLWFRRVNDALFGWLVLEGWVVNRAYLLIEVFSFSRQFALSFLRLLHLIWKFACNVFKLAIQVLDLTIFAVLDQG